MIFNHLEINFDSWWHHFKEKKDSKILISKRNQDFLFSHKTQIPQYRLDDEVYELRDQEQ